MESPIQTVTSERARDWDTHRRVSEVAFLFLGFSLSALALRTVSLSPRLFSSSPIRLSRESRSLNLFWEKRQCTKHSLHNNRDSVWCTHKHTPSLSGITRWQQRHSLPLPAETDCALVPTQSVRGPVTTSLTNIHTYNRADTTHLNSVDCWHMLSKLLQQVLLFIQHLFPDPNMSQFLLNFTNFLLRLESDYTQLTHNQTQSMSSCCLSFKRRDLLWIQVNDVRSKGMMEVHGLELVIKDLSERCYTPWYALAPLYCHWLFVHR